MKLVLEIPYSHSLIVDTKHQASLLEILSTAKLYTSEGWDNKEFTPVDTLPTISFCKDSSIKGIEDALESTKAKLAAATTAQYAAQNAKAAVEKRLKELEDKLEGITQAVVQQEVDCQ